MQPKISVSTMKLPNGSFYITVLEVGLQERTYMEDGITYTSKNYREIRDKIAEIKKRYHNET